MNGNIARPRTLTILNPEGGCVVAVDLVVLEQWTSYKLDSMTWRLGKKGEPIMYQHGSNFVHSAVVGSVSAREMQDVGCHWLDSEQAEDAAVCAQILFNKLKKAGYTVSVDSLHGAVREVVLPGPATESYPEVQATLNPPIREV